MGWTISLPPSHPHHVFSSHTPQSTASNPPNPRQDLAKPANAASRAGKRSLQSGPIALPRTLPDPAGAPALAWAPRHGPVRPLLQLMCVLPARSAGAALPGDLANLVVIAQEMDDAGGPESPPAPQRSPRGGGGRGGRGAGGGGRGRRGGRRGRAGSAFAVLEGGGGDEAGADGGNEEDGADGVDDDEAFAGSGSAGDSGPLPLLPEFAGDTAMAALLLAEQLRRAFPSRIEPLVDLAGKKWLHTGVVRLPVADPLQVCRCMLQLLRCGAALAADELRRNRFAPADVVAGAGAAAAAGATAGAVAAAVEAAAGGGGAPAEWASAVWRMLVAPPAPSAPTPLVPAPTPLVPPALSPAPKPQPLVAVPTPLVAPPSAPLPLVAAAAQPLVAAPPILAAAPAQPLAARPLTTVASSAVAGPPLVAAAAAAPPPLGAAGGALGALLARRAGGGAVRQMTLDIAGLPPPPHACALLPGAEPPLPALSAAKWRRLARQNERATHFAERVLGFAKGGGGGGSFGGGRQHHHHKHAGGAGRGGHDAAGGSGRGRSRGFGGRGGGGRRGGGFGGRGGGFGGRGAPPGGGAFGGGGDDLLGAAAAFSAVAAPPLDLGAWGGAGGGGDDLGLDWGSLEYLQPAPSAAAGGGGAGGGGGGGGSGRHQRQPRRTGGAGRRGGGGRH